MVGIRKGSYGFVNSRQWRTLRFSLLTSPNILWREIFGRFSKGGEGLWMSLFQENSMQGTGSLVS